jgi:Glyoxalase/Bleomycin resistance protein/Dioxygenase superfamily.
MEVKGGAMITALEHTALSVSNLERSLAFYRDLLGFTVERILEPAPERDLGRINGLPGSSARIAHLRLGPCMVELFEYLDPRGKPQPKERTQADIGFIHMGLTSTDVRSDYRGTELEFVIMVIAVSCVKLLSAHNSTQHTSRKHKV